jgi:hypothetical protein
MKRVRGDKRPCKVIMREAALRNFLTITLLILSTLVLMYLSGK